MRFKCVFKFCNSLLSESTFVDIHQCHSVTRTSGNKLFLCENGDFYTTDGKEDFGKVSFQNLGKNLSFDENITCVNGLFCCTVTYLGGCAIIWNPSTRVVRYLPKLEAFDEMDYPTTFFYLIGFEPEEKTYKVLMGLNDDSIRSTTRYWIFTLGIDKSWREIKNNITTCWIKTGVYIDGVIYLLNIEETDTFILAFDVKTENFKAVTLWDGSDYFASYWYHLTKVNGKLAVVDSEDISHIGNIYLWISGNETRKEEWEEHIIRIPQQFKGPDFRLREFTFGIIGSSGNGEILLTLEKQSGEFIHLCYDVTEKRWEDFKIQGLSEQSLIYRIYSYDESLFPVEKI